MGGNYREEVLVAMGIDNSAIERGLGVNRSHFQDYLNFQRSEEGKYSNWWNTELKKREEAEVAASIRAASRSIQARRLLREREAAREMAAGAEQAAANTVIGQGSLPAGWAEQAAAKKAGRELEMKAAEALKDAAGGAHGAGGAMRELMVVMRELARGDLTRLPGSLSRLLGMIGLSTSGLMGVGLAAAEAAAIFYEMNQMDKAVEELQKTDVRNDGFARAQAKQLRVHVDDMERVGKLSHEEADKQRKLLEGGTLERNQLVMANIRKHGGVVTKHDADAERKADEEHAKNVARYAREDMNAEERTIMSGFKVIDLKAQMAKLDKTGIEYKQKQLELDEAQRNLLSDQKDLANEKAEAQRKANEEQQVYDQAKLRMNDINQREREKFMPTLEELAHHGRFGAQARGIGRLERRIKRDYERGDTGAADSDIAQRNKIYDSLADRHVVAERADIRETKELTAKMQLHIAAIHDGKAAVTITPKLTK